MSVEGYLPRLFPRRHSEKSGHQLAIFPAEKIRLRCPIPYASRAVGLPHTPTLPCGSLVSVEGIGPSTSVLSGQRSTTELHTHI